MSRASHSLTITTPIPPTLPPARVISALHNHTAILSLQALTTDYKDIPLSQLAAAEITQADAYFQPVYSIDPTTSSNNLKQYLATEAIPIIPGAGDWAKISLSFLVWFQDTQSGVRTRADAPAGVVVRAEYTVQTRQSQDQDLGVGLGSSGASSNNNANNNDSETTGDHYANASSDSSEWVLVENVSVECNWFLMPFVKRQMERAHRDICRRVIETLH
ncbi:hypothetical protein MPDQ_007356 [Monascus purpureus]|uniref:DUF7053 domain-containing protein n=1 Tax=Monascus purpureus TaxID=5098 RepID=A0A507QU80_MONPU|nr:hypothetical protein MPDQ_007356 [Monascus purpureus]BDD55780.1 hypothetical protein MAP00_001267 [Monascus purpureus]